MLKLQRRQIEAFEAVGLREFEDGLVAHLGRFSPRRCGALADGQLRAVARDAIERARAYDFTRKGPIRLFTESMLLLGARFDSDPQYSTIASPLRTRGDQMIRAERIHAAIVAYQTDVLGAGGSDLRAALAALIAMTGGPATRVDNSDAGVLQALAASSPARRPMSVARRCWT